MSSLQCLVCCSKFKMLNFQCPVSGVHIAVSNFQLVLLIFLISSNQFSMSSLHCQVCSGYLKKLQYPVCNFNSSAFLLNCLWFSVKFSVSTLHCLFCVSSWPFHGCIWVFFFFYTSFVFKNLSFKFYQNMSFLFYRNTIFKLFHNYSVWIL